jgi:hypothetical protein
MNDRADEHHAYLPILPEAKCPETGGRFALPLAADWSELVGQKAIVTAPSARSAATNMLGAWMKCLRWLEEDRAGRSKGGSRG